MGFFCPQSQTTEEPLLLAFHLDKRGSGQTQCPPPPTTQAQRKVLGGNLARLMDIDVEQKVAQLHAKH